MTAAGKFEAYDEVDPWCRVVFNVMLLHFLARSS
jgi:hypothetical protein